METVPIDRLIRAPVSQFAQGLNSLSYMRPLERLVRRPPVSVVIPIFNAHDALARCLESIHNSSLPPATEILLIDDHSSERAVHTVCHDFAAGWPATKYFRNDRNLGFVSSVNRGMREAQAGHDVLLLNSDTVVTPNWLTRLSIKAHLSEQIASVSALSNAAGAFSIPKAYGDADLPLGVLPRHAQRILEFVSERAETPVPSTSGFCMLIKRRAIEEVGYFDSCLFLRGYGEENDWNERATSAGFAHHVDTSRFIYHTRGLSFGSSREQLKQRNSRILVSLHPTHAERLRTWEKSDDLTQLRGNYGTLLQAMIAATSAERAALFDAPVIFRVGSSAPAGVWSATERRISITERLDGYSIDFFGILQGHVSRVHLSQLLFELAYRWDPSRIEVERPEHGEYARVIARIFEIDLVLGA